METMVAPSFELIQMLKMIFSNTKFEPIKITVVKDVKILPDNANDKLQALCQWAVGTFCKLLII